MVLGDLDSYMPKNETRSPYTEINSRWIKDLNISHNTIKVLKENIGRKISDIQRSNILTDMSPEATDIKERINKWDLIKMRYHPTPVRVDNINKSTNKRWRGCGERKP